MWFWQHKSTYQSDLFKKQNKLYSLLYIRTFSPCSFGLSTTNKSQGFQWTQGQIPALPSVPQPPPKKMIFGGLVLVQKLYVSCRPFSCSRSQPCSINWGRGWTGAMAPPQGGPSPGEPLPSTARAAPSLTQKGSMSVPGKQETWVSQRAV